MKPQVKKYFGNSLTRKLLSIISKQDKGSSKLENVLLSYDGKKLSFTDFPAFGFVELLRKLNGLDKKSLKEFAKSGFFRKGALIYAQSIAEDGITTPQRFVAPHHVVWNLTNRCNIGTCEYCYQDASTNKSNNELNLEQKLDLIDQLADIGAGYVVFSGGEPLTDKNFFEIIEYTTRKNLGVSVATNGILLGEETAKRLKETDVRTISISLNSTNPETHNSFTGKEGCWQKSIKAIENAKKYDLRVETDSIISSRNFSELEDLIEFEKSLGIDRIKLFSIVPVGRGKHVNGKLTKEQEGILLQTAYKHLLSGIDITVNDPRYLFYLKESKTLLSPLAELSEGCYAGRLYCAIQPDGIVTPCALLPIKAGDVKEKSFSDIWKNSEVFEKLRDRNYLKGSCGNCKDNEHCGGCRARAYGKYGDYLASDPSCGSKNII